MTESKLLSHPVPHTFTARCPEQLHETRGYEEQKVVQGQWSVFSQVHHQRIYLGLHRQLQPSQSLQHMPANDDGHAYNELYWHPIEMLGLKHVKEAIISYII
jgi:hypothetical protein